MAKKLNKTQITALKAEAFVLENFDSLKPKINYMNLNLNLKKIFQECRTTKKWQPLNFLIEVLVFKLDIACFKKFRTHLEIEKYLVDKVIFEHKLIALSRIDILTNRVSSRIKEIFYLNNSEIKKFDDKLKLGIKLKKLVKLDESLKEKYNECWEYIEKNQELLNKSVIFSEFIREKETEYLENKAENQVLKKKKN